MKYSKTLRRDKDVLSLGARSDIIPASIPCPSKCKFCYEHRFTDLFPWIKTRFIAPYTDTTFDYFLRKKVENRIRGNKLSCCYPVQPFGRSYEYLPSANFFSLGMSKGQIEKLINEYHLAGKTITVYTTGQDMDIEFVKYLNSKYPDTFRIHLSVITFDRKIRLEMMNPKILISDLKAACKSIARPIYFLIHFNNDQIISDIKQLNECSIINKGEFYIHKLFYNRLSSDEIRCYADNADGEFEALVVYLKKKDRKLNYISHRLCFSPAAEIYAWVFRDEIRELFQTSKGTDDEAIFCSEGAYDTIKNFFSRKSSHIIPIKGVFGGNIDFAMGMTVRQITAQISLLIKSGYVLRRIFIPDSMFCIEDKYDLNLEGVSLIRKAHPKIKVRIVKVPVSITKGAIGLDGCIDYFKHKQRDSMQQTV